jgi:HAD superfamily hydrolase (TIGR01509 family)
MVHMAPQRPDWSRIDTVLLDLDGTLLDLAFDSHFWLTLIPQFYAEANAIPTQQAAVDLAPRFKQCEGTLNWYCIDYWSRELGLNVAALKRRHTERIRWIPGAESFLKELRARGKRLVLLTNCHPEVLRIKDEQTGVTDLMDAVHSSHTYGAPKEDPKFWASVREVEPFDTERTMFVDDSPRVLRAARQAGLHWIYAIRRPDSSLAPRDHEEFTSVDSVAELL